MPVAVVSPPELCRGSASTDAAAALAKAKKMGPRDAPAAAHTVGGARAAGGSGKHQADEAPAAPAQVPLTPHGTASAAAAAALAARDQLLVAGATPESSFLALLVRESEALETEAPGGGEAGCHFEEPTSGGG